MIALLPAAIVSPAPVRSVPSLGMAEGRCRPGESGPALVIEADGLIDRRGLLRAELYPDDDRDFLADDNVLVAAGRTFRRAEARLPQAGPASLCIRAPAAGRYALALIHVREGGRRFSLLHDGIGFPGDPALGLSRPKAAQAAVDVPAGVRRIRIRLNYRRGLFSFGPVRSAR